MNCLYCKHIKDIGEAGLCLEHTRKLFKYRNYIRLQMRKWRAANPERWKQINNKAQNKWRTLNPQLNRLRAKLGMQKLKERLKWKNGQL